MEITMQLITEQIRTVLIANGQTFADNPDFDPHPVVKLFTPDAGATWLIASAEPEEPDILFGLCDLGLGYPELGTVRLSEIAAIRGAVGLPVERDLFFVADRPLSEYTDLAGPAGAITV
jgi:hypothetical protein